MVELTVLRRNAGDLSNWDVRNKLEEIDVPTLVINGARDFAQECVCVLLGDRARDAFMWVLPLCGVWIWIWPVDECLANPDGVGYLSRESRRPP